MTRSPASVAADLRYLRRLQLAARAAVLGGGAELVLGAVAAGVFRWLGLAAGALTVAVSWLVVVLAGRDIRRLDEQRVADEWRTVHYRAGAS